MDIYGKEAAQKSRSCLDTLSLEFIMQALTAMHDASPVGQVFGLPCEMNVQNKASHQKIKLPSGGPRIWRPSPGSETQIDEQWKGCRTFVLHKTETYIQLRPTLIVTKTEADSVLISCALA